VTGAVVGGTTTTARPEVGMFIAMTPDLMNSHACTATLIGPREFVTAAHCLADQAVPTNNFTVHNYQLKVPTPNFQVDSSTPCSMGCPAGYFCDVLNNVCAQNVAVERVFPQWVQLGAQDLAVGRLAQTPALSPASIATAAPASNANLTLVGYGCINRNGSGSGVRRYKTFSGLSANYCSGDSGGPTFVGNLLDFGPIARVASTIDSVSGLDISADPVTYRSQVIAMANAMESTNLAYRAQLEGIGFQEAVTNCATAGTTGQSRRLEALQIWSEVPGVVPAYRAYIQGSGWQGELQDGDLAGTVGQSLRMEALQVRLAQAGPYSHVMYRAYVQGIGWQPWVFESSTCSQNGQCPSNVCAFGVCAAGTTGRSLRIEAVQMQAF
jgi:hypothetical protein